MREFLTGPDRLLIPLYLGFIAMWVWGIVEGRRKAAREAAASASIRELKRRLWDATDWGSVQDPEIGALIVRAERADRAARGAERVAVAALTGGRRDGPVAADRLAAGQADYAIDAEGELERLLTRLRKDLPPAALAELESSQAAFRDYRDAHVRLCRDFRDGDSRLLVRHYASEAVTRARLLDLEDIVAAARLKS